MKKTSLVLHFLKKNMKAIQEVCKGNASEGKKKHFILKFDMYD